MYRYKLLVEYCGTNYRGMQKQNEFITIEGQILKAINKMFPSENIKSVNYSGRTDAGVHAIGQVVDFLLSRKISSHNIVSGLNNYLSHDEISIISCEEVEESFHSRFSAKQRIYTYRVITRKQKLTFQKNKYLHCVHKLDFMKMKTEAQFFLGRHDFSGFCSSENEANPIRTIDFIEIKETADGFEIYIGAKSFLHNMVRIIVGTLIDIGRGKITKSVKEILELKDRKFAGKTVDPCGLYLLEIKY